MSLTRRSAYGPNDFISDLLTFRPSMDPNHPRPRAELGALREVPFMGVIYVVHEASKLGFTNGHPDWCNLGQGQPEVGEMEGRRRASIAFSSAPKTTPTARSAAPTRCATPSPATTTGFFVGNANPTQKPMFASRRGRLALTRVMAALGAVNVGYQLPDYTAYEDMFDLHLARLHPIPVRTREEDGFAITPTMFEREVVEKGLSAFVLSNPCNPTGNVVSGSALRDIVEIARRAPGHPRAR